MQKLVDNYLLKEKKIETFTNEIIKIDAATTNGKVVLLVGIATAQGTVEVKDVYFEAADSKLMISNKTAV